MRSLRLAAAAILVGAAVIAVLGGAALAAPATLAPGFPATRIKLDPPSTTTLNMPGPVTLTATAVDWHGVALRNVVITFSNVAAPLAPPQLSKGTTERAG